MYHPYDTEKYPKRKNPRLPGYDYSCENKYFVTICTHGKKCLFGTPGDLNSYGQSAARGLQDMALHYPDVSVEKWVVMPNHIHAIVYLRGEGSSLNRVIGSFKSYVTKMIHHREPEKKVWQASYHDHIIRNEAEYQKIWLYIEGNPMNWDKDCFYTE